MEITYTITTITQLNETSLMTKVNYVVDGVEINDIEVMHYNPISHDQIKENIIARGITEQANKITKTIMDEAIANPSLISQ
jgi:uncharacterized protein YpmB